MTLTKANVLGFGFNEKLTSDQVNHVQDEYVKAIDGDGGGTYAPSPRITIAGDGLHMTALLECEGNVVIDTAGHSNSLTVGGTTNLAITNVDDVATFTSDLVVTGSGTVDLFAGSITITSAGGLNVGGGVPAEFNGNTTFNNGFDVPAGQVCDWDSGAVQVSSTGIVVSAGSNIQIDGTASFADAVTIGAAATVSLAGILTPTGAGRVRKRIHVVTDGASNTFGINDGDIIKLPAVAANRTWTLTSTGASTGDVIHIDAFSVTAFSVLLVNDAAGGIITLQNASAGFPWAMLHFHSGAWHYDALSVQP